MISIVIPTYRRCDLLVRLLDSIRRQTDQDYEVIVVDDASPNIEEYQRVIERYQALFPRFRYIRSENNRGAPHSRNIGIRAAQSEWIALVDDDDEWLPHKLVRQRAIAMTGGPEVGLIYTWTRAVDDRQQLLYESKHSIEGSAVGEIFATNFIMSASVMVRKSAIEAAGLFDEALPSCQDWDMWARILACGYHTRVVPEILTIYHRHGQASVGLSPRAYLGYRMFLEKHWQHILRHTNGLNIAKKSWLYMKTRIARHA